MSGRKLSLAIATILLVVAAVLAGVRRTQMHVVLAPAEIAFTELHNLSWDPVTRELNIINGDPYGYLILPGGSRPLTRLTITFDGEPRGDGWYVYPAPAELPVVTINQDWVVTAVMQPTDDAGFTATWDLRPSRAVRIDLPDDSTLTFFVRHITLDTPFAASGSAVFVWLAICAALGAVLALGALLWPVAHRTSLQVVIAALAIAAKLWLVSDFEQTIFSHAMHDDQLFLNQAISVRDGDWLGPFWQLTLAKGPAYSVFVALSSATGQSLQFNTVLFDALAALVFIAALAPWVRHPTVRGALLLVLVFQPHSFSAELIGRVLRAGIQPALTLLAVGGLIGLLTRVRLPWWRSLPWALLAGLAGGAFWYSREEGIWLVPTALLLLGTTVVAGWRAQTDGRWRWLLVLLVPLLGFVGVRTTLRAVNEAHYGVWIGVDVSDGSFPAAYGAMLRVTQPDPIPGVPVTAATRELIYPHSPAFAELRAQMEGEMTRVWSRPGWEENPDHPRALKEIRGGWYQWALRQAASRAGHYPNAAAAEAYWQQVADEINAAVDRGDLAGGAPRHGFFPVWHEDYNDRMLRAWGRAIDLLVRFTDFKARAVLSRGDPEKIVDYAAFLHAEPALEQKVPELPTHARIIIYRLFALIGWPLSVFALVATGVVGWRARREVASRSRLALLLSLWGGTLALSLVCALVDATSFTAVIGAYLGPAVPLILSCWVLAPWFAWGQRSATSET